MYPKILSKDQIDLIAQLEFIEKKGFYLAGGTALALQLGHRTSMDFDFYTDQEFDSQELWNEFSSRFTSLAASRIEPETLLARVEGVGVSFFRYPYKLLKPVTEFETIDLAAIEDIAAMKIAAVVQRGVRRDFVDIFYLLQRYGIKDLVGWTIKKYPGYQQTLILKGLIYFDDAEEENLARGIKIVDKSFSWEKAKQRIFEAVKAYQLAMLKR
jgi:hypothetical protein